MKRNAVAWAALVMSMAALIGSRGYTKRLPAAQDVPQEGQRVAQALSDAFGAVADYVAPSVVQINVEKKVTFRPNRKGQGEGGQRRLPPGELPKELEDMLKRFLDPNSNGNKERESFNPFQRQQFVDSGTGSGFVFDDQGHILTNNHVVEGADKIVVTFHDGAQMQAKVVGRHPESDVAVIKVEASNYRPVKIGSSKDLKVGQWVLALGSPFGLDHTVTAGIISATERQDVGINRFESFVQTDAAINPGNSGGPLVDLSGHVVAINSAIATASRSNSGVGFAIPIDMAARLAEKLIKNGKVVPAMMGVAIEPVTPALARQLGLGPKTKGLLVTEVYPDSPADKAGLKQNDVILSFDGQPVANRQTLQYLVSTSDIGHAYTMSVMRDGREQKLTVSPASLESVADHINPRPNQAPAEANAAKTDSLDVPGYGFSLSPLTEELAKKHGWSKDLGGMIVTAVAEDGPAANAGLEVGDRITSVIKDRKLTPVRAGQVLLDAAANTKELIVQVWDVRKVVQVAQLMTIEKGKSDADKPVEAKGAVKD